MGNASYVSELTFCGSVSSLIFCLLFETRMIWQSSVLSLHGCLLKHYVGARARAPLLRQTPNFLDKSRRPDFYTPDFLGQIWPCKTYIWVTRCTINSMPTWLFHQPLQILCSSASSAAEASLLACVHSLMHVKLNFIHHVNVLLLVC